MVNSIAHIDCTHIPGVTPRSHFCTAISQRIIIAFRLHPAVVSRQRKYPPTLSMYRPLASSEILNVFAKSSKRESATTARKKLTTTTEDDRRPAAYPQPVDDRRKAEESATLQASIPFGFLFLNRH
jgi:hypothetical protein